MNRSREVRFFEKMRGLARLGYRRRYWIESHDTQYRPEASTLNTDDIAEIERETGRLLPQSYASVLMNYPIALIDPNDQHEQSPPYLELYRDKKKLIAHNPPTGMGFNNWRNDFFIIGDNGCGEAFVIDTTKDHAPVFVYSNHGVEFEPDDDVECEWEGEPFPYHLNIGEYVKALGG